MQPSRKYRLLLLLIHACFRFGIPFTPTSSHAAVEYFPATETILVTDYPEDYPCTPRMLARIDKTFGWNRVHWSSASNTITVAANLVIGWNDGSSTCFQIGNPECPNETLIVQGELRVYPFWLEKENRIQREDMPKQIRALRQAGCVNRLQLGMPDNPEVHAELLLEKHARGPCRLVIGGFSGYSLKNAGGQLLVYNSMIAAKGDDLIEAAYMGGNDRLELVHATIRGFRGVFGHHLCRGIYKNSRFEKCGVAVSGNHQENVKNCTFHDCRTAILVTRDGVLNACSFSGNNRNWLLNYKGRLIAIDCVLDTFDKGVYSQEPTVFFISKRHVVVKVTDLNGQPVKGAIVDVQPEGGVTIKASEYDVLHAVTGTDGRTPGQNAGGALLLSECLIHAGSEKDSVPEQSDYCYTIKVSAGGRSAAIDKITPERSWKEYALIIK